MRELISGGKERARKSDKGGSMKENECVVGGRRDEYVSQTIFAMDASSCGTVVGGNVLDGTRTPIVDRGCGGKSGYDIVAFE